MSGPRERAPRRLKPGDLDAAARRYLERFVASSARLRQVLRRRIDRACAHHGDDPAPLHAELEQVIARLIEVGLLDDRAFARLLAASLRRRGDATPTVRRKMRQRGLPAALIDAALEAADADVEDPDLVAAARYARRRRLGPFRPADARAERREKDLAALGRAGFGYAIARRVVDAEDADALPTLTA